MIETIGVLIAQGIAGYALNKGLTNLFENREDFEDRLSKIINQTIEEYEKNDTISDKGGKFGFYKSKILVEELLKFRFFKDYTLNEEYLHQILNKHPNIIPPTNNQLTRFLEIFNKKIQNDKQLRQLEINENYKEEIFQLSSKFDEFSNFIQNKFKETEDYLEQEYKRQINKCQQNIESFKPRTALEWLEDLEDELNKAQYVSDSLRGNLSYIKGLCLELIGAVKDAWTNFTKAYKLNPHNKYYKERACLSYFYLEDEEKSVKLADELIKMDEYNVHAWFYYSIKNLPLNYNYLKEIPKIVKESERFKRLVFNWSRNHNDDLFKYLNRIHFFPSIELENLPLEIDYKNFFYWIFILELAFQEFLNNELIFFHKKMGSSEVLRYISKILYLLNELIEDSEIEDKYYRILIFYYWSDFEINENSASLVKVKSVYKEITEIDSFVTLLYANSLQKAGYVEDALKEIDNFKGDLTIELFSLKMFCQISLQRIDESINTLEEYIDSLNIVHDYDINVLLNNFYIIRKAKPLKNDSLFERLISKVKEKGYEDDSLKILFESYIESLDPIEDEGNEIENHLCQISNDIEKKYPLLKFYIADTFSNIKKHNKTIEYLESWIDKQTESRELLVYIYSLYYGKTNQIELLRLLKLWRENFSFHPDLMRIEIELRQNLPDWLDIEKIASYALTKKSKDEFFFTTYLLSLESNNKEDKIKELSSDIKDFYFNSTQNCLLVAALLIRIGENELAFYLVYNKASNKNDKIARANYISWLPYFPTNLFQEYNKVEKESLVKYRYNGDKIEYVKINEQNIEKEGLASELFGKSVGDIISVKKPITDKTIEVRILRIMNSYLALYDEILEESKDPFSDMPFEIFDLPGENKEETLQKLIDLFGSKGSEMKAKREENLKKYYDNKLSLAEITTRNFDNDYISSFYYLTSPKSKGFWVTPKILYSYYSLTSEKKYVIDLPTALLFYALSNELDIEFKEKFIIPNFLNLYIEQRLKGERIAPYSDLSLDITLEGINPTKYPKDFKENRILFLENFKQWLDNNTIKETPKDKLNIINQLKEKGSIDNLFEYLLENLLLTKNDDYVLITDDSFNFRMLSPKSGKIISTEILLLNNFQSETKNIIKSLLKRKFLGVTINREVLYDLYCNKLAQRETSEYYLALQNVSLLSNFSKYIIDETIEFIRKIAENNILSIENYRFEISNILVHLIRDITNSNHLYYIRDRLNGRFYLTGHYYSATLESYDKALDIINKSK